MKIIQLFFCILACLSLINCGTNMYSSSNTNSITYSEQQEFQELMKLDSLTKTQRIVETANQFLNDDDNSTKAAVLSENKSNCNIIVRMNGNKSYRLPVLKNDINFLMINKGNYQFRSKLCRAHYKSSKQIVESVKITLSE